MYVFERCADMQKEFKLFWEVYAASPLKGRNVIVRSFCSKVYGLYVVKVYASLWWHIAAAGATIGCPVSAALEGRCRLCCYFGVLLFWCWLFCHASVGCAPGHHRWCGVHRSVGPEDTWRVARVVGRRPRHGYGCSLRLACEGLNACCAITLPPS